MKRRSRYNTDDEVEEEDRQDGWEKDDDEEAADNEGRWRPR